MELETIRVALGWCTVMNVALLFVWFVFFWLGHDWIYGFHRKLAKLSVETFDTIHYAGMAAYKIAIFMFNLVPYLALSWMG